MEEYEELVETARKQQSKLVKSKNLVEFKRLYQTAKPTFDAVEVKYKMLSGLPGLTTEASDTLHAITKKYDDRWKKVREYRDALGKDPQPLEGGRKRKMTRRYCKKTPCRKMGFTQKASCRPWKNCYQ